MNLLNLPLMLTEYGILKGTNGNKSVYAIAAPYRESLLAKDDRWVDGGSARPGFRRGPPLGVTVFAIARIK
jgi:hypothetical protein